jgi:hypothetical protein
MSLVRACNPFRTAVLVVAVLVLVSCFETTNNTTVICTIVTIWIGIELYRLLHRVRSSVDAGSRVMHAEGEHPLHTSPLVATAAIACKSGLVLHNDSAPSPSATAGELASRKQACDLISAAVVLVADHFRPPMPIMSSFSIWWRQEDLKRRLPANVLYNNLSTRCLYWKRIHVELKISVSKTILTEFQHICEERERGLGFPPGSIVSVGRASSEVTPLMCCPHYDSTPTPTTTSLPLSSSRNYFTPVRHWLTSLSRWCKVECVPFLQ